MSVGTAPLGMPTEMLSSGGTLYDPVPIADPAAAVVAGPLAGAAEVVPAEAAVETVAAADVAASADVAEVVGAATLAEPEDAAASWRLCATCAWAWGPWALTPTSSRESVAAKRADSAGRAIMAAYYRDSPGNASVCAESRRVGATRNATLRRYEETRKGGGGLPVGMMSKEREGGRGGWAGKGGSVGGSGARGL